MPTAELLTGNCTGKRMFLTPASGATPTCG
jgi:hypothetical protein